MKFVFTVLLCALLCAFPGTLAAGDLSQLQNVYLLPMASGLDQYLAQHLTAAGIQVVTDPAKANVIFTDRVGESLNERLDEMYPPPKPPSEAKTDAEKAAEKDKETAERSGIKPVRQGFGKGRGNLFLIDRATRAVIWSIYERPKNTQPDELDRTAGRIIAALQKARGAK